MSSSISLTFGDVFEWRNEKYIFLVPTLEFVYIAKVLSDSESKVVLQLHKKHLYSGSTTAVAELPLFWFVRLTCDDFKGQLAHLAKAQQGANYSRFFQPVPSIKIPKEDLDRIKEEIMKKRTWPELKKEIKDL